MRVLVIGAGFIARKWIESFAGRVDVELAGILTRSADRGRALAEATGRTDVPVVANCLGDLPMEAVDAVIVTTPQHLHPEAVINALEAGRHVLVEKPLAIDWPSVRAILAVAERHPDCVVMVNQNFRWRPHVQALRRAVLDETIGRIEQGFMECRQQIRRTTVDGWRERMAEPYLLDFAIHHVDLLRYVLDDDARAVSGCSYRPAWSWLDGNTSATACIEMQDGASVAYSGTMVSTGFETPQEGVITLVGERGSLRLDADSVVRLAAGGQIREIAPVPVPGGEFGYALTAFVAAVAEQRVPEVGLEEHVRSLSIVFGIIESARTGQPVACGDPFMSE